MSWPTVELSSVCSRVSVGHVGKTSEYYTDDSGVPFLRTQNVSKTGLNMSDVLYVTEEFHQKLKKSQLRAGDVVLSRVISTQINCDIIPERFGVANCANIILVRPNSEQLDSSFLKYYLRSEAAQKKLLKRQVGSAQSVVNTSVLKSWEIPLPPLDEQKRIAAILDKADAIRRKRQKAIDLADDFLRSVFLDMFGDPVTNPKGWDVKPLNVVAKKITDGTHDTPSKVSEGVKFVTGKNIRPFKLDLTDLEYVIGSVHEEIYSRCNPEYGDLLLTNIGAGTGNACFNSLNEEFSMKNVALVKSNPNILSGRFMEYLFNHQGFQSKLLGENSKGGAQKFLSLKVIREAVVPVPNFELQEKFADIVEKVNNGCLLDSNTTRKTAEAFNSLSQQAFAGELQSPKK